MSTSTQENGTTSDLKCVPVFGNASDHTSKRKRHSPSTSDGSSTDTVVDLCYDDYFDEVMTRLMQIQPECCGIHLEDVIPLARVLKSKAGCAVASALWIAIKFSSVHRYTPDACLMAEACHLPKRTLIMLEATDLKAMQWDIAPYAREVGLLA